MCKFLWCLVFLLAFPSRSEEQNVPTLDVFLSRLLDVTTNEIQNLANSFNFHEVSPKDVKFILHTKNETVVLDHGNTSRIDPSKPIKVMIHGWQATGEDSINRNLSIAYHDKGNYNVIIVDWSEHSKKVYMHSSSSTKDVGKVIGDFIMTAIAKNATFLDNVHIIGHSLGAHVAGFAGKHVDKTMGQKVGRITGLDVAAPMFLVPRRRRSSERLSSEDATFVDVIHTNAGFLGVSEAIGSADFYVENGGPIQPGCLDPINIFESIACSHLKAFEYFVESISGKNFEAVSCRNSIDYHTLACNDNQKVIMGENVPKTARGPFYLETNSPLPYRKLLDNPFGFRLNPPPFRL